MMEEDNKLPLKRVELSLTKFNEVAIPHHLDLLRQHKTNIIKYERSGELARARSEQTNARRVAAQLRALLLEMEALRQQVRAQDRRRFDLLTQRSRDTTLRAVVDYLGLVESSCRALVWSPPAGSPRRASVGTSPLAINREPAPAGVAGSATSTESVGVVEEEPAQLQLQVAERDVAELELRSREELLRGWSELQAELRALHDVWQTAQAAALAQRDSTEAAADSVAVAADNVSAARKQLAAAERLRAAAYGASGAVAGALLGGPVGLAVGAKAGALAAAAGSLLGYLGVRALGRRAAPAPLAPPPDLKDKEQ